MTTPGAWTIEVDRDWIAWLTFDLPGEKVNKFTRDAMAGLDEALDRLAVDEAIKAVAVRSAKRDSFIVGADIDELARIDREDEAQALARRGQAIFSKLTSLPVPTVAVIHGACLGGGLEMALACDYRLVTDHAKTSLGLPEVGLGILPGWGGTQRLPRLIGLPQALGMILTGKPVSGRKAVRMGLADGMVAPAFAAGQTREFIERVITRSGRQSVDRKRKASQPKLMRLLTSIAPVRSLIYRRARKQVAARTNGNYPAPLEALRVIRQTYRRRGLEEGLEIEAAALGGLAAGAPSRNLVWVFQASQRMRKGDRSDAGPLSVERSAVVGAGIMGAGIAWALSNAGSRVRLRDVSWSAVAKGVKSAAGMYAALVKRRKMTAGAMNLAMLRIGGTVDYCGFANTDVVVEAVIEDLDVKRRVLRDIEANVGPDTLICTNTSSLPLQELAQALRDPRRFIGLHFFNPVNRMPLVEVIPCRKTSRHAVAMALELVRWMGKTPVLVGDCPGFLVNRILLPYLIESTWMFEEGAPAEQIDRALERFGMPMGPLTLVDEVGIDVGFRVAKVLEAAYGARMHVAAALEQIAASGEILGRKSGRGIYVYNNGHKTFNEDVTPLVEAGRARDGVSASELGDEEIVDRAILIMVNEAARCLDEGVVGDPEALDMAMVMGTGFAPFRGGLLRYADARGIVRVKDRLEQLARVHGDRFQPASLIEKLARKNGSFYGNGHNGSRGARP